MSRYPRIDLDGALVAITGAARGIGLATAKELAAAGAYVALGDLDEALAEEAASTSPTRSPSPRSSRPPSDSTSARSTCSSTTPG